MKLLISLLLITITLPSFSQSNDILELVKITSQGLSEKQDVHYDKEISSLIVGNWIIPVSQNSHVKRLNGNEVEFLFQKGTVVTSLTDPQLKRASIKLTFNSRKSAQVFINTFRKAAV